MAGASRRVEAGPFLRGLATMPCSLVRYARRGGFSRRHGPIFVVGCGHSGTTLLRAMLGRSREVYGIGHESELFLFHSEGPLRKTAMVISRNPYRAFSEWQSAASVTGRSRWVEKTPRHVQAIKWILFFAPNARVVMITRDPLDVVASMLERGMTFEHSLGRWIDDNRAVARAQRSPRCFTVRYEDLVTDPADTLAGICDFVGIGFDSTMLVPGAAESVARPGWDSGALPEVSMRHLAHRLEQIRSPLFDGRGRWQRDLDAEQVDTISAATRELRAVFRYADEA